MDDEDEAIAEDEEAPVTLWYLVTRLSSTPIQALIQSTQHQYSFASDDTSSATKALSNKMSSKDQTIILQAASTTITTALKKYPARISPRAYRLGHLQAPVRI